MEEALTNHLLTVAAVYCVACGLNDSTVGRQCAADGRFFSRIREGKTFTIKKYDEVIRWFSANWPDGAAWPADVPRPSVALPEAAE